MKTTTRAPALGADPFAQGDGTVPYVVRLREQALPEGGEETGEAPPSLAPGAGETPPVPEGRDLEDGGEGAAWLDRLAGLLLERRDEERLARLTGPLGARGYDRLGLSPRTARRALAFFKLLYRYYFRVESRGYERIPEKGAVVVAANHGGLLPFDAAMMVVDLLLRTEPPRLLRAMVDRWAGALPFVNIFFARVGQVVGSRENFRELLRDGQAVLTFPEGRDAIHKRAAERYVLREFRVGFVEESIRLRVPIVPVGIVGPDDQAPILYDFKSLARRLGLPTVPVTPTFPLLGPLGLLPYPVKYEIRYGEPFRFYREYPPESLEDPRLARTLAEQVRRRVQEIVDQRVLARRERRA